MVVTSEGTLAYIGHKGQPYEVVGGSDSLINLKELE
jgi:hypothetical protein